MIAREKYRDALLAGKAELTVKNPRTGKHVKISCRLKKGCLYYVKVALLGDKEPGYVYAGAYFSDTRRFKPADDLPAESPHVLVARRLMSAAADTRLLLDAEVLPASNCCRCRRKLTHPDSIHTGLGPECAGHTKKRRDR